MQSKILLGITLLVVVSNLAGSDKQSNYEYGKIKKTKEEKKEAKRIQNRISSQNARARRKNQIATLSALVKTLTAENEKQTKEINALKNQQQASELETNLLKQQITFLTQQRDYITTQYWEFWRKQQAHDHDFVNNVFANNDSAPHAVSYQETGNAQISNTVVS